MISLDELQKYVPSQHGEHGVDSVIHRLCDKSSKLYESYCNPPGASWAEIKIIHPATGKIYSWDHIPRKPSKAKRPDSIIQYNENHIINLLSIESKQKISDKYANMNNLLKNFFTGNSKFNGLFNRPTQHRKDSRNKNSQFLGCNNNSETNWIKNYDRSKINLYSGFAFAFEPEFYSKLTNFQETSWISQMKKLIQQNDLDIIIGVGWYGETHIPFTRIISSDTFSQTNFGNVIETSLKI